MKPYKYDWAWTAKLLVFDWLKLKIKRLNASFFFSSYKKLDSYIIKINFKEINLLQSDLLLLIFNLSGWRKIFTV